MRCGWKCSPAHATSGTCRVSGDRWPALFLIPTSPRDYDNRRPYIANVPEKGEMVRKLIACLITAGAISTEVPILHNEIDFDVLARHTPLQVDS